MKKILNYEILAFGDYTLHTYNVVNAAIFILLAVVIMAAIRKLIYRTHSLDTAKKFSASKLSRYVVTALAVVGVLHFMGFNVSVLLAGSAALLVGLGFGLQNLFNDFISGVILLLDATLKVGDIIEVNGMICRVQEINFRTTTVLGRDENYVIVPNSELTGNRVLNWTYNEISSRFSISIGLDYSTDVDVAMEVLRAAAEHHPMVRDSPAPFVRFEDYADSALMFSLYFFSDEIFRVEQIKSEIRTRIFKSLKEHGIEIPFPQRVVHMKSK